MHSTAVGVIRRAHRNRAGRIGPGLDRVIGSRRGSNTRSTESGDCEKEDGDADEGGFHSVFSFLGLGVEIISGNPITNTIGC